MSKKIQRTQSEIELLYKAFNKLIPLKEIDIESTIDAEIPFHEEVCLSYIDNKGKEKELNFTLNIN